MDYATGWMTEESWFDSPLGQENVVFFKASRLVLTPTASDLLGTIGAFPCGRAAGACS
jgi:hypothetical protein